MSKIFLNQGYEWYAPRYSHLRSSTKRATWVGVIFLAVKYCVEKFDHEPSHSNENRMGSPVGVGSERYQGP